MITQERDDSIQYWILGMNVGYSRHFQFPRNYSEIITSLRFLSFLYAGKIIRLPLMLIASQG